MKPGLYYWQAWIYLPPNYYMDGPQRWFIMVEGAKQQELIIEHQYYRNTANDDKYLTQEASINVLNEVMLKHINEDNYDILFYSICFTPLQNKLQKMIDSNGGYWYIGINIDDNTNKGMASKTKLTVSQLSKWGFQFCSSNCGYNLAPYPYNDSY